LKAVDHAEQAKLKAVDHVEQDELVEQTVENSEQAEHVENN